MTRTIGQQFYNIPDGGSGGGAPAAPAGGGAPQGSGAPPAPAPAPGAPASAAPPASGQPPAPGTPPPSSAGSRPPAQQYTYTEDRSNWIPPRRLSEVASARQQLDQRNRQLEAMLAAATGVRLNTPEQISPEIREAREAFQQVFPGLAQLEQRAGRIMQFLEAVDRDGQEFDFGQLHQIPQLSRGDQHRWEQHGETVLNNLYSELAQDYGVESLTPRQQRGIGVNFMTWLEEDATGDRVTRYTRGDKTVQSEFLEEFRAGFVHPLRRTQDAATLQAGARARHLPPAPQASGVAPAGQPPAVKSLDQHTDDAWNAFAAAGR